MGKLMVVNGSPRAPHSNSKRYLEYFLTCWKGEAVVYEAFRKPHAMVEPDVEHLLFVFPLYVDALPVTLMQFLKQLRQTPPSHKPMVHLVINCGFLEHEQNRIAIDIMKFFCEQNGYPFGCVLSIGSGEAIFNTPFAFLVKRKLKALAKDIAAKRKKQTYAAMPLPKSVFISASTKYWIGYGAKNGVTGEQMRTMKIEES